MKLLFMRFWLVKASALLFLFISQSTVAQIIPDATLPVNSRVTQQGNTNLIEQGTTAGTKVSGSKLPNQMVAATGWVINNKGEVTLIASAPSIHANQFLSSPTTCRN